MFSDPESDNSDSSDSDFEPEKEVYLLVSEILLVKAKKFVLLNIIMIRKHKICVKCMSDSWQLVSINSFMVYGRTLLIRSPMGPKKLAVLTGWPYTAAGSNFMT